MRPNSPEIPEPSGLEAPDYKEQMQSMKDKSKALDELPDIEQVRNRGYRLGKRMGFYTGSWYKGGAKKFDNPGGGKGTFMTNDEKVILKGEWGKNGELYSRSGTIYTDGKSYNIGTTYFPKGGDPIEFVGMKATGVDAENCKYEVHINEKLEVDTLTYKSVTLNVVHEGGNMYLKSAHGGKLLIGGGKVDRDLAATYVASQISKVKKYPKVLDYFEVDYGTDLQADYKGENIDQDLIENCYSVTGIGAQTLCNWLNNSRKDFGI